jgi:hypothetical protein
MSAFDWIQLTTSLFHPGNRVRRDLVVLWKRADRSSRQIVERERPVPALP